MGDQPRKSDDVEEDFFQIDGYRKAGPPSFSTMLFDAVPQPLFLVIIVLAIAWMPVGIWLMTKLNWPDAYGWHCGFGNCWGRHLWHSPLLLKHHTPYEIALFIDIWMVPAGLVGILLVKKGFKLRGAKLSIYSDNSNNSDSE